jgi:hypothetical protein
MVLISISTFPEIAILFLQALGNFSQIVVVLQTLYKRFPHVRDSKTGESLANIPWAVTLEADQNTDMYKLNKGHREWSQDWIVRAVERDSTYSDSNLLSTNSYLWLQNCRSLLRSYYQCYVI